MASIFGHAIASSTLFKVFPYSAKRKSILWIAIFCSIIPDADVIMFKFGYQYEHWLGHRGFFHSIFFCLILGFGISYLFFKKKDKRLILGVLFSLSGISHGILDAMTSGGRGIAFFAPFDNSRFFFPWRPILVSPLGVTKFFSDWGIAVLKSEAFYIAIPCLLTFLVFQLTKSVFSKK